MPGPTPQEIATDARSIAAEAKTAEAGRITFLAEGKFVFSPVDEVVIASVLATSRPQRYKFQIEVDGRWVDNSKYNVLDASTSVLDALREGDLLTVADQPIASVGRAAAAEPRVFATALRGLSRHLGERLAKDPTTAITQPALRVLDSLSAVHDNANLRYLRATADLLDSIAGKPLKGLLEGRDQGEAIASAMTRMDEGAAHFSTVEGKIAASNVLGKIHSMCDRELAVSQFRQLRELDTSGLIEHFYVDTGAMTYVAHGDIDARATDDAEQIRASIEPLDSQRTRNKAAVAISMDPRFYRIYSPLLHYYAQQLPAVDYNIILCGDPDGVDDVVADSRDFVAALDRMNHSGSSENVHFYRMAVPEYAAEPKTFYASARFFAAQTMLEHYESVYTMDADLTTDIDPQPFFRRIASIPFGTPHSIGFPALSPWRRYMAGNVPMNRRILDTALLDELQAYLAYGLRSKASWMLDQNALAYVIERHPEHYTELNVYKRPFTPPKFRAVWEKNFRG